MNVAIWSPGLYLMRLTTTEGHFAVGKFTKQWFIVVAELSGRPDIRDHKYVIYPSVK